MAKFETLREALIELQKRLPRITKDKTANIEKKTGGSYRYKFVDLETVSEAILPILADLEMSFTSMPTLNSDGKFVLEYELLHVSGEKKAGQWPLSPGTPQDVGIQITYARRYSLVCVTGLAPGGDDDAAAMQSRSNRSTRRADQGGDDKVNADQMKKLHELFSKVEITGKDQRVAYARETVKRDIESATELTRAEADVVIAKLTKFAAQSDPGTVK